VHNTQKVAEVKEKKDRVFDEKKGVKDVARKRPTG
jgi:hypothetical protein